MLIQRLHSNALHSHISWITSFRVMGEIIRFASLYTLFADRFALENSNLKIID